MADFTSHVRKALLLYRRKRHASSNHTTGAPHVTRTLYTVYSPVSAVLMAAIGTASKIGTQVRYNERAQLACQEQNLSDTSEVVQRTQRTMLPLLYSLATLSFCNVDDRVHAACY